MLNASDANEANPTQRQSVEHPPGLKIQHNGNIHRVKQKSDEEPQGRNIRKDGTCLGTEYLFNIELIGLYHHQTA